MGKKQFLYDFYASRNKELLPKSGLKTISQ